MENTFIWNNFLFSLGYETYYPCNKYIKEARFSNGDHLKLKQYCFMTFWRFLMVTRRNNSLGYTHKRRWKPSLVRSHFHLRGGRVMFSTFFFLPTFSPCIYYHILELCYKSSRFRSSPQLGCVFTIFTLFVLNGRNTNKVFLLLSMSWMNYHPFFWFSINEIWVFSLGINE